MPKFNNGEELNYLEKDDIILSGDPDNFSKVKTQNLYKRTLTRSQLQALISANTLNVGQQYIISNSVSNTMPLKVTAVGTNVLDQKAVRVSNGENYTYDIVTDAITSPTAPIILPNLTTSQINALTPVVGMMVFNTTINHFVGYHVGGWVKFNHSNM
jgi:hypothetical protein